MRRVALRVRIDCHKHSLTVALALEDTLLIRQHNGTEVSIVERRRILLGLGKLTDPVAQIVPLRFLKACPKRRITLVLMRLRAPLTSVIYTGNAGHTEAECID